MDLIMTRGDTTDFSCAVADAAGVPFPLDGCTVTWRASNGTQELTKVVTVSDPESGVGRWTVAAADTADWPDYVLPLSWTVVVVDHADTFTVGHGSLIVNSYREEAANA
jgi:hypothetical protein